MEKKESNHKKWAGEKKPSMKRRSEEKDYLDRGIYLITIATEGRVPLLGTLAGNADVKEGPDKPHVILSPAKTRQSQYTNCTFQIKEAKPLLASPLRLIVLVLEKVDYIFILIHF